MVNNEQEQKDKIKEDETISSENNLNQEKDLTTEEKLKETEENYLGLLQKSKIKEEDLKKRLKMHLNLGLSILLRKV